MVWLVGNMVLDLIEIYAEYSNKNNTMKYYFIEI